MQLGPYIIIKKLKPRGTGLIAEVCLARDTRNKQLVALKLIELVRDDAAQEALKAEKKGAMIQQELALLHPNVPKVLDFGDLGQRHFFIAMEYVVGEDLSSVLKRQRLSYKSIMRIVAGLCSTLEAAHKLTTEIDGKKVDKIFHGDIKPQNIRLTPGGEVKLLDFGIAKGTSLTRNMTYNAFATLEYCSPERLEHRRLDEHADLWSVGVLLYEMVCGERPFQAEDEYELLQRFRSKTPPNPLPADCPLLLKRLIEVALSFDMSERPRTAAEMSNYLRAHDEKQTAPLKGGGTAAVKDDEEWDDIVIEDSNLAGLHDNPRPRLRLWPGVALGLGLAALVILALAIYEYTVWKHRRQLGERVSSANVIRRDDVDPLWASYQTESAKGFSDFGLPDLRAGIKRKLSGVAEYTIKDYASEKPEVHKSQWEDVKTCLTRAMEVDGTDPLLKAMLHYCDGHLDRINGNELRDANQEEQAGKKYQSAIRHFRDATTLQPQWADPHLALSVVYTYNVFDSDLAPRELDTALALGLKLGRRETALRADWLLRYADQLLDEVNRRRTGSAGDYQRILGFYEQSLEKYRQIPNFSNFTSENIKQVEERISLIRKKLQALSAKAAAAPQKKTEERS